MSIDYDPVAGIGITITEVMEKAIIAAFVAESVEGWSEDGCDSFYEDVETAIHPDTYSESGCFLSGTNIKSHMFVHGKTLGEINKNATVFVAKIADLFNIIVEVDDLEVISEQWIG